MTEPTFDSHGYPTEETLEAIRTWPFPFDGLMDFVKAAFQDYGRIWEASHEEYGEIIKLATGGWSGNEEVIYALQENHIFWSIKWRASYRGGLTILDK